MDNQNLLYILQEGESDKMEFKTSFGKEVIESLVAFSNSKGGKVIVGINDAKDIIGASISDESIQNWLNQIKQNTIPQIIPEAYLLKIDNKNIVVFDIQEYPVKPVAFRNKYFKRIANSNHLMSIDEIANEHLKTINSSWDYYPDPLHTLEHISMEKVDRFIKKIEQRTQNSVRFSSLEFLEKLEITRNKQLTFGAYLLFAKSYCTISDVQVGRFKSDTAIIDSLSINTDIITETDEVIAFIKKHLMVEYIITGELQRTERFDYPLDAIREIVINMIVHRDYRDSGASIIKIFDDRIEFYNPGNLFGGTTVDDLLSGNYTSKTRNKLIAKAFKEIGWIERYGSGITRIRSICMEYRIIEPKFKEVAQGFKVTLYKQKVNVTKDVTKNVTKYVTKDDVIERLTQITKLIRTHKKITVNELADQLKINRRTVLRDLDNLKNKNIIRRSGGRKIGHWEVIK